MSPVATTAPPREHYPAALADEARAWLAEIEWADLNRAEALQLPDEHAIAAVERHYDGGLAAFIADGAAV